MATDPTPSERAVDGSKSKSKSEPPFHERYPMLLKVGLLGLLALLMLVPLGQISSVIRERAHLSRSVEYELGTSWGRAQTLAGPILLLPVEEPELVTVKAPDWTEEEPRYIKEQRWNRRHLFILPEQQNIAAELTSQTRRRGIYEALLYTTRIAAKGQFSLPAVEDLPVDKEARLLSGEARLLVHLSDLRGSAVAPRLQWERQERLFDVRSEALPGEEGDRLSWIQAPLPALVPGGQSLDFSFDLELRGSRSLHFVPLGRDSEITLAGDWPHPGFAGVNLPVSHQVTDEGFSASWQVSHLARGLPQVLRDDNGDPAILNQQIATSGVETQLVNPVNFYRKSERSVKYGLLFVIVTFGALFIFETLGPRRLHVVQYLLVGAALALFFLLQLSLAEVVGFAIAYGLAALVCVLLVALYAARVTASRQRGLLLAALLGGVYGYLFMTLQSQDHAIQMGSLMLLALLAAAMYVTRDVDWYALGERITRQP